MSKNTLLITGGTGFLGRALALRLRDSYDVTLTGRNNKQNQLATELTNCKTIPMDVANIESVRDAFAAVRPQVVIHAAATKYVDLAEREPMECVDVNVTGSQNVARVSIQYESEIVLGVSTDKAAPPVRNTYGLSKAIMERIFCGMHGKTPTQFACVRYGNVAWSTGSVLPLWKKMHESTGEIGTTGPQMTRFFFTVDEAVDLILAAMDNIELVRGKVLARQMKSAKIQDILDTWIKHHGGTWKQIAGRPGERLQEYLIGESELEYTQELTLGDVVHYLIAFNTKAPVPLRKTVNSDSAVRLVASEMLDLISPSSDLLL